MATDVIMPKLGESITEGTILEWKKNIGDNILRDEFKKNPMVKKIAVFTTCRSDMGALTPLIKKIYKENYQFEHQCADLLNKFTYGLPEIYQDSIKISKNIAVPGPPFTCNASFRNSL